MAGYHNSALALLAALLAALVLAASPVALAQTATGGDLVADAGAFRTTYRKLTCRNHNDMQIYFSVLSLNPAITFPPTLIFHPFSFQEDAMAQGGYRIMAAFMSTDGTTTYTAEEGFDPCIETTCAGVTCANTSKLFTQQYLDFTKYIRDGLPMEYQPYGVSRSATTPRCGCMDPVTATLGGNIHGYVVDPRGPAAPKTNPVCAALACSRDAAQDVLYYLNTTTGNVADCKCYRKQLDVLTFLPAIVTDITPIPADEVTSLPSSSSSSSSSSAIIASSSSSSSQRNSKSNSNSDSNENGGPDPITPSTTLTEFLTNACPDGTLNSVPPEALAANASSVCCYLTNTTTTPSTPYACGDALLSLRGPGQLNCVSSMYGHPFQCCARIDAFGGLTTIGRFCPDAFGSGDGAAGLPTSLIALASALLAAVLAAAV